MQPPQPAARACRQPFIARAANRVAGLDLAAGRGRTALTAVEWARADIVPTWQRTIDPPPVVVTDADIVATLMAQPPAVLAIDAPLSLPARVTAALGIATAAEADPVNADSSSYTRAAERDPIWREFGVRPLPVSFLGGLTFRALALLPLLRAALPHTTIIEAFPSGALAALGVRPSTREGSRAAKTAPRVRAWVQAGLRAHLRGVPDPADELLDADTLDALACALTAVAFARGTYRCAGDPREGQIILPR